MIYNFVPHAYFSGTSATGLPRTCYAFATDSPVKSRKLFIVYPCNVIGRLQMGEEEGDILRLRPLLANGLRFLFRYANVKQSFWSFFAYFKE